MTLIQTSYQHYNISLDKSVNHSVVQFSLDNLAYKLASQDCLCNPMKRLRIITYYW